MKKAFTVASMLTMAMLIVFACKKNPGSSSTSATSNTSSTSGTTGASANTVTVTTSSGPMTGTITPTCYSTSMYGTVNNVSISSVNLTFYSAPAAGTYNVVSTNPNATQVLVAVNGNYASGGTVTISLPGGKKSAVFNNVVCSSPSHTLTGGYTCP